MTEDDFILDTYSFAHMAYSNGKNWYSLRTWFSEDEMKKLIVRNNAFPKILKLIETLKLEDRSPIAHDIAEKLEDIIKEEKIKASRMSVPK